VARHKSSSCVLVLCVGGKCGEQGRHLADWNPEFIFQLQAVGERNGLCVDVLVWPYGSCGDLFDGKGWRLPGVQSVPSAGTHTSIPHGWRRLRESCQPRRGGTTSLRFPPPPCSTRTARPSRSQPAGAAPSARHLNQRQAATAPSPPARGRGRARASQHARLKGTRGAVRPCPAPYSDVPRPHGWVGAPQALSQ